VRRYNRLLDPAFNFTSDCQPNGHRIYAPHQLVPQRTANENLSKCPSKGSNEIILNCRSFGFKLFATLRYLVRHISTHFAPRMVSYFPVFEIKLFFRPVTARPTALFQFSAASSTFCWHLSEIPTDHC
jgi:hypothetical protein